MTTRVLLVEDATGFRKLVASFLTRNGYEVFEAWSIASARRLLPSVRPEIVLLDLQLEDGFSHGLLQECVAGGVPVIILSAHSYAKNRISALRMGAEDFMAKPVSLPELHLRIQKVERFVRARQTWGTLDFGGFVLDLTNRMIVHKNGPTYGLSPSEFQLLRLFIDTGEQVLTRQSIARKALGSPTSAQSRAVDVLVSKLRKKLGPRGLASPIESVRGEGYRFNWPRDASSAETDAPATFVTSWQALSEDEEGGDIWNADGDQESETGFHDAPSS